MSKSSLSISARMAPDSSGAIESHSAACDFDSAADGVRLARSGQAPHGAVSIAGEPRRIRRHSARAPRTATIDVELLTEFTKTAISKQLARADEIDVSGPVGTSDRGHPRSIDRRSVSKRRDRTSADSNSHEKPKVGVRQSLLGAIDPVLSVHRYAPT